MILTNVLIGSVLNEHLKNVFEMLKRKVESGYKEYKNLYVKSKIHI